VENRLDDMSKNDIKNLEERTARLEEAINKLQLVHNEKFNKLETDFKVNLNNIETKNLDITNQTRDLQDTLKSIERNKTLEDPPSSYNKQESEFKKIRS